MISAIPSLADVLPASRTLLNNEIIAAASQRWFNTAAFAQPSIGAYGNSSRDIERARGVENVDASFFKTLSIYNRLNLETHFEAFSLFTTPTLASPATQWRHLDMGRTTPHPPGRIAQVAMKFIW